MQGREPLSVRSSAKRVKRHGGTAGDSHGSGKIRTPRARMSTHQLGARDYARLCAKDLGLGAGGRGTRAEGARARLLHFLLLCLGFFQDGNVGVGIFPEGEEILVGSFRFGGATRYGMRTGNSPWANAPVRQLLSRKYCLSAHFGRTENFRIAARVDVVSVIGSEGWMVCVLGNFLHTQFLVHTCLQQTPPAEATL